MMHDPKLNAIKNYQLGYNRCRGEMRKLKIENSERKAGREALREKGLLGSDKRINLLCARVAEFESRLSILNQAISQTPTDTQLNALVEEQKANLRAFDQIGGVIAEIQRGMKNCIKNEERVTAMYDTTIDPKPFIIRKINIS